MKAFRKHKHFWSLLAFWLLFTTTGFSINEHYCNGILKNIAILIDPGCCDEDVTCHKTTIDVKIEDVQADKKCCSASTDDNQCCSTEYNLVQLDVELLNTNVQSEKTFLFDNIELLNSKIQHDYTNLIDNYCLNFYLKKSTIVLKKAPLAFFQSFLL